MSGPVRVKVCCIQDEAEAELALELGASALGLVSAMPSGPGPIPEERIARIAAAILAPVDTFLLSCLRDPDEVIAQIGRCGTTTVQLVDAWMRCHPGATRPSRPGTRVSP